MADDVEKIRDDKAGEDVAAASLTPVIGIGASAGGVEALGRFFDAMPDDSGAAFVIVLHLDPTRESHMAHVLSGHTAMPVVQVEDGVSIAPNHVYVIAPDYYLKVGDEALHLLKPAEARGHRRPVDVLFASIAESRREKSIAIVLSGTGTNGTEGLKAIRAEGGMAFVQTPDTAKFDGMPRSAISEKLADQIMAPEEMPAALLRYLRHDYIAAPGDIGNGSKKGQAGIAGVLDLLRARGGHDFRNYKQSTLRRRVHRRLGLRNVETLDEYLRILRDDPAEIAALVKDLMINVTAFFRDPEAWKALTELTIAPLVANRESGASIRMWTPGCSTGQEAYSLAMLVTEQAELAGKRFDLKIFATDPQEDNLRQARDGVFPASAMAGFPPERLRRFFEKLDGSYQVRKELRDMIVFAPQDLLRDPPFSRLDLVSCRNLLIYLEPAAQQRIIALCHFALRQGGYLFLGNAETVGKHDELFETVSKKWRIYRRMGPTRHDIIDFPTRGGDRTAASDPDRPSAPEPAAPVADVARRALLERYAPASVLIDRKCRALYFHGRTGDYLEQPTGEPTKDLMAMAREGLVAKLRGAVREAMATNQPVATKALIRRNGRSCPVAVTVSPLPSSSRGGDLLVTFEEEKSNGGPAPAEDSGRRDPAEISSGERDLQEELSAVRAELQNTIEHLETANEELKASNEEATSMNEELQSTNEELETSKEELQSFNEELNTVNSQLQHKIGELENTTNDLNNLLAGSETATLFLDTDLRIKWFAPATRELFNLVSSDIGRSVADFARKFADEDLLRDAEAVLGKLTGIDAEVSSDSGRWYLRRMLPYRTRDNRIAGVVITFGDITERKQAADAVNEARIYSEAIVSTIRQPLLVLNGDLRVQSANSAFYDQFDAIRGETEGRLVYELGNGQWDIPRLRELLQDVLTHDQAVVDFEVEHDFTDLGRRCMLLNARRMARNGGRGELILLAIEDITERSGAEAAARRLAAIVSSSDDAVMSKDLEGVVTSWNDGARRLFGYEAEEIVGKSIMMLAPPELREEEAGILARLRRGEHIEHFETVRRRKDGSDVWVSLTISPLADARGAPIGGSTIARDMTERRQADKHRKILIDELNHRVKNSLAKVQAIATQTFGDSASLKEARAAFSSRLIALAKAHDLLTHDNWEGADLVNVVKDTIEPHDVGDRFRVGGPHIQLPPSAALAIAMALHELSTNAAKYGALSDDEGHVDISWRLDGRGQDRRLALRWTESGGPPVTPPARQGFGTRLIERALALELNGEVRVLYEPSGVVCAIDAPMPLDSIKMESHGDQDESRQPAYPDR
ncbi:chemotaxis protein CheB [Inquilinus sp. CAU 1745]|uniref:chemotaxis protein CheB n=1 Tax=Inquilinus sp. CAU 1745 TaxID=3140369 RepID=UPI00325BB94B